MTIPHFNQSEFISYLKEHGFEPVCDDYFEKFDRIMLSNGVISFPLQLRKTYFYPIVVKTCISLNIPAPEEHIRCYNQHPPKTQK